MRKELDYKTYEQLLNGGKIELIVQDRNGNYYFMSKKNWRRKEKIINIYAKRS